MPLNKLSSGYGFETTWHSCGVTVITMLRNAISVLQMISSPIKVFGYFFCSRSWHALSKLSSGRWFGILVSKMILSTLRECWCFLCYWPGHAIEQTIEWLGMWHFMTLMWGRCNNNASKRSFSFTNNFHPNQGVSIFLLLSVMGCRWANCQADCDFERYDARVSSLLWQCCKTRFLKRQTSTSAWVIS